MLYKRIFPNSKGGSIESEQKNCEFSYLLVNLDYADSYNNFLVIFKSTDILPISTDIQMLNTHFDRLPKKH